MSDPIYIHNAGLVLTGPFLPRLFDRVDLLEPGGHGSRWRDSHAASRAVHILQYLAGGETPPEPMLALNKVLCGLPLDAPVEASVELTPHEVESCNQLLLAMIANWKALSGSSVEALRETFLRREGKLRHEDDRWLLQVQRKTLDVLVDQIPWSFGVMRHDWMLEPVYVTW